MGRTEPGEGPARSLAEERLRDEAAYWNRLLWGGVYKQAGAAEISMSDRLLLRHVLIVGSTGSGKTNHAFQTIREAFDDSEGSRACLIIDVKGEYRALEKVLSSRRVRTLAVGGEPKLVFNPLIPPPGVDAELWDRAFADVFTRAYGLSEPSRRIVLDSLFRLREGGQTQSPTIRELEREVGSFEAGSPKEQNSKTSLGSRLHIINTGPVGTSLNSDRALGVGGMDGEITVLEVGRIDSLRDQRFVAELVLLLLWYYDKFHPIEREETLKRLIVVEEAHRYLSEERPSAQRGERTLIELAIAEARRYGWGFVVIDQMPLLLSRYVWDNMGTVFCHRLSNVESLRVTVDAIGGSPVQVNHAQDLKTIGLSLPEGLAMFRSYSANDPRLGAPGRGVVRVPRVK